MRTYLDEEVTVALSEEELRTLRAPRDEIVLEGRWVGDDDVDPDDDEPTDVQLKRPAPAAPEIAPRNGREDTLELAELTVDVDVDELPDPLKELLASVDALAREAMAPRSDCSFPAAPGAHAPDRVVDR